MGSGGNLRGCSSTGEQRRGRPKMRVQFPPISTSRAIEGFTGSLAQEQSAWLWTRRGRGGTGTPSQSFVSREARRVSAKHAKWGQYPHGCPMYLTNRRVTRLAGRAMPRMRGIARGETGSRC